MASSLFSFSEVEAKTAKPLAINGIIRDLLRDDGAYAKIERYLLPPGVSGSKAFDQAYAVGELLIADAANSGRLAIAMENSPLSRRLLWDHLYTIMRGAGFKMSRGRLVGLLEGPADKPATGDDNNVGQPDIE